MLSEQEMVKKGLIKVVLEPRLFCPVCGRYVKDKDHLNSLEHVKKMQTLRVKAGQGVIVLILPKFICVRCGWVWVPSKEEVTLCPKCKSPYWDKPYKEQSLTSKKRQRKA